MKPKEHTHKFERRILGSRRITHFINEQGKRKRKIERYPGTEVWKCVVSGCTTFIPTELAIGYQAICWNCEAEMTLDKDSLMLKHPTHKYCRKVRMKQEKAS